MFSKKVPTKAMLTMRLVIAAYIIYLATSLIKGIVDGTSENPVFMGIASALFLIGGLWIIVISLRDLIRGNYDTGEDDAGEEIESTVTDGDIIDVVATENDTAEAEAPEAETTGEALGAENTIDVSAGDEIAETQDSTEN